MTYARFLPGLLAFESLVPFMVPPLMPSCCRDVKIGV